MNVSQPALTGSWRHSPLIKPRGCWYSLVEKRKQTAPLPLSSWPACWNDTCPFITGEIGSEEEEGIASAGLLWLCQLLWNRRQEWKRGAGELRLHVYSQWNPNLARSQRLSNCSWMWRCEQMSVHLLRLQVCLFNDEGARESWQEVTLREAMIQLEIWHWRNNCKRWSTGRLWGYVWKKYI